jgi:cobalamin biosynthesis protein CobT
MLSMPPLRQQPVDLPDPRVDREPVGHRQPDALDRVDQGVAARPGDEVLHDLGLQERPQDAGEQRRCQQRQRRRDLADRQECQQHQRQQVQGRDVVDVAKGCQLHRGRDRVVDLGTADQPQDQEDDQGDQERRHRGPGLAPDVRIQVHPDHLGGQHRRLGQR